MANPVVNGIELELVAECQHGAKLIKNAYWFASGGAAMYIQQQPNGVWRGNSSLFGFSTVKIDDQTMEGCAAALGSAMTAYLQNLNLFHGCSVSSA